MSAAKSSVETSYPPGALPRDEAAAFVGLGTTSFDDAVRQGHMPKARRYPHVRRLVWLTRELEAALRDLPVDGEGPAKPREPVDL